MNFVAIFFVMIPFLLLLLLIPILIGVYVYRDAKRRQMNAVAWTAIAVLAPTFIGLIIYLLVRGNYSDLLCPNCGATVSAEFVACPKCGAPLRAACPKCQAPVEPDWKVCPRCATPLTEPQQPVTPIRRKDKALWKLLAVIVLVTVLLLGLIIVAVTAISGPGSMSFQPVTREELEEYITEEQLSQIDYAVQSAEMEENQACAFRYVHEAESGNTYYFLLYVPDGADSPYAGFGQHTTLLGTTVEIELYRTYKGGDFYAIASSAEHPPRIKLTVGMQRYDCQIWDVDFNPTPYVVEISSIPPLDEGAAQ